MKKIIDFVVNAVLAILAKVGLDSPNRIVIALSPLFVTAAGYLIVLVAKYAPGHPNLDSGQLTALFATGSAFAAAKLLLWLHGWQAHEKKTAVSSSSVLGTATYTAAPATLKLDPEAVTQVVDAVRSVFDAHEVTVTPVPAPAPEPAPAA